MEKIELLKDAHKPYVLMDAMAGLINFEGNIVIPDTVDFFEPIFNWIKEYSENEDHKKLVVDFKIVYYNTAASKMILKMFHLLKELKDKGISLEINWYYKLEDEEMYEDGVEIAENTELEINFETLD